MKKELIQTTRPLMSNHKCSLILRLWREERYGAYDWRASVDIPEAGRRFGFASLEQLFAFVINLTETNCNLQLMDDRKECSD